MSWWLRIRRRRALDEDIADEIAFHRHLRARDHAPPPFGNETIIRERMRELWTFEFIETTLRDLGLAARGLRRNPAFAVTIITSMALAIGAAAAIFTAADIFLLRPLPYRDPGTLVMLFERNPASSQSSLDGVSPDNFLEWRSRNSVFEGMAYIDDGRSVFSDGRQSAELHVQRVPPEFFHLLGVQPARGGLASAHDPAGAGGGWQSQVVISYRLWQNWFGGAPDVIGRSVEVDASAHDRRRDAARLHVWRPGRGSLAVHGDLSLRATRPWRADDASHRTLEARRRRRAGASANGRHCAAASARRS